MLVDTIRIEIERLGKLYRFEFPHTGIAIDFLELVSRAANQKDPLILTERADAVLVFKKNKYRNVA